MARKKRKSEEESKNEERDDDVIVLDGADEPAKSTSTTAIPSYVVEVSKSGRAECRKCDEKIANKVLRVGVMLEGDWGLFTRWQHLHCTIFHSSLESVDRIDGYNRLSPENKDLVEKRFLESKSEIDYDFQPLNPDDLVRKCWETPMEPSSDLLMPLLPYQKEGLGWMVHQENSECRGGILADEMGMGKTIQAISVILSNRPDINDKDLQDLWLESDAAHGFSDESLPKGGTLIVLPTVAIRQWQMEINRFTREGTLKVKVYHGSDRSASSDDLSQYDIIITSYKVLEIEYRKATAGTKVMCRVCGKKFYPEKLRIHRKYFCGETAQRTEAQLKTEKKLQRPGLAVRDDDDDDEEESEDEITKQKKANKSNKSASTKTSKASSVKLNAKRKQDEDQSIDEIEQQKAAIKKSPAKGSAKKSRKSVPLSDNEVDEEEDDEPPVSKAPRKSVAKPLASTNSKANKKPQVKIEKDVVIVDTSDENDQGEENLGQSFTKAAPMKRNSRSAAANDSSSKRVLRTTNSASKEAIKKAVIALDSENDEVYSDGSEYQKANSSSGDSPEESADDDNVDDVPSSKKKRTTSKKSILLAGNKSSFAKTPPSKATSKSASSSKKDTKADADGSGSDYFKDDNDDDDEDDEETTNRTTPNTKLPARNAVLNGVYNDVDEDVERDIKAALRAHEKRSVGAKSCLHLISWLRIILDEAHLIKDRSTSTAKAVFNLVSLYKWCLTGTPLQNRVGELYSLIRFLRIDPHAFYFCRSKECTCKSLHYRFTKSRCDDCGHSVVQHFCFFNKHILNPIQRSGYVGDGKRAMLKLKQQILDEILLRRTKITRAEDIQLPMRIVKVRQEKLDDKEDDFYQALYTQSQAQFNTYLTAGTVLNNYAHIFDILIRLRQAVDHPYLVIYSESQKQNDMTFVSPSNNNSASSKSNNGEEEGGGDCGLCHDPMEDGINATCGHGFCRVCIMEYIDTMNNGNNNNGGEQRLCCPDCSQPLSLILNQQPSGQGQPGGGSVWDEKKRRRKSILDKIDLTKFQTSTKMEALMQELYMMEQKDCGAKAIVFSQFVNMLDLLDYRIQRGGIGCKKLLGSMNLEQRDNTIKAFKEDPNIKVLLISLKAGGVALNLTIASHIFLMDPWWNPAAEMQAIDRTHRIGQFKPIFATRFIIEDSIEERILKLQEKKKLVFDGTVGGDVGSMAKLTVDDMRFLFH